MTITCLTSHLILGSEIIFCANGAPYDQDDSYEPYIPIAKRRQEKIAKLSSWGINAEKLKTKKQQEEADEREDALKEEELRRENTRKERTLLIEAQEVHLQKAAQGMLCSCMSMACR